MIQRTYWNSLGKHNRYIAKLNALILEDGSVFEPIKNPALVHFRKASVLYYELHGEDMIERYAEFRAVFNIGAAQYKTRNGYTNELYVRTEAAMDDIVLKAAKEQKLI